MVACFILLLILTGCGNTKTLTCSSENDGGVTEKYTFKFSKEKLKTIIFEETVEVESEEEGEKYKKQVEEEMKVFSKLYNLKSNVTFKNKKVISTIEVTIEKLNDEYKSEFENVTYEEMKQNSTKTGLSCK